MTLQEKYRLMLGEAEEAFSKREKELADYREEAAKAICKKLVMVFSEQIEEALDLKKIADGSIMEIKKTFILSCSISEKEFCLNEKGKDEVYYALDSAKLKGNLMKKFLERLKKKLKENGIETDFEKDSYTTFQAIVTLSNEV